MFIELLKNKGFKLALIWLLVVNVIGLVANNRLNLEPDDAYSWIPVEKYDQHQAWNIADIHYRWDSGWYHDIFKNGYQKRDDNTRTNIVFFPLYPILLEPLSIFFGGDFIWSGWFLSCVFLLLSGALLFRFTKELHKDSDPLLSVFLLLIFPTAFFLNGIYTESMFLFFSLAAFYFSFKRNYLWAGIFGALAALTRITGILLFLPLVVQAISSEGFEKATMKKIWPLSLIALGTLLFFMFHWIVFGNFWLFFEVESAWGRSFSINREHFVFFDERFIGEFFIGLILPVFRSCRDFVFFKIEKLSLLHIYGQYHGRRHSDRYAYEHRKIYHDPVPDLHYGSVFEK